MNVAATQPRNANAYAFNQGLPVPVVLRLLDGSHTPADRAAYYRTDWWAAKKSEALEHFGRCCMLCGTTLRLQVHHRGREAYKHLFREDVRRHLSVICERDHRRFHRK